MSQAKQMPGETMGQAAWTSSGPEWQFTHNNLKSIDIDALIAKAESLLDSGEADSAMEVIRALAPADESGKALLFEMANRQVKRQRFDSAASVLRRLIELFPSDAGAKNALGVCLVAMDRLDEALTELEAACRLDPDSEHNLLNLAKLHLTRRDWQAASDCLGRFSRLHPGRETKELAKLRGIVEGQTGQAGAGAMGGQGQTFGRPAENGSMASPGPAPEGLLSNPARSYLAGIRRDRLKSAGCPLPSEPYRFSGLASAAPGPAVALAPKEVVFVKANPQMRIFKQALALKRAGGFKLTLLGHRLDQNLFQGVFDEIKLYESYEQLAGEVRARSPYLFHAHAEPNLAPAVVLSHARAPMIYDAYDFAGLRNGVEALPEAERGAERLCLEKAAGIINKFSEKALDYYRGVGYTLSKNVLHYMDYCAEEMMSPMNRGGAPSQWHIVHVGAVAPADYDREQFKHMQFHDVARILDSQGIHFHIYPNPYQYAQGIFGCYAALARELECFHFHEPVPPMALSAEIGKYHWGSNLAGHPRPVIQDAVVAIGNKFTSYLEAGLPILAENALADAAAMVREMGVGAATSWDELKNLGSILSGAYEPACQGVRSARRSYSIENHCRRLADFYRLVAGE